MKRAESAINTDDLFRGSLNAESTLLPVSQEIKNEMYDQAK